MRAGFSSSCVKPACLRSLVTLTGEACSITSAPVTRACQPPLSTDKSHAGLRAGMLRRGLKVGKHKRDQRLAALAQLQQQSSHSLLYLDLERDPRQERRGQHFSLQLCCRTCLRIGTPADFKRKLCSSSSRAPTGTRRQLQQVITERPAMVRTSKPPSASPMPNGEPLASPRSVLAVQGPCRIGFRLRFPPRSVQASTLWARSQTSGCIPPAHSHVAKTDHRWFHRCALHH